MNIIPQNSSVPPVNQERSLIEVETARAVQQVQAALTIAKRFPRDEMDAYIRTMKAFERQSLAEKSIYSYPRGGGTVSGPSIRMAEVLARSWGNIECGIRELERKDGKSIVEAFCWDVETNFKDSKIFEVAHKRDTKGGGKALTDERDIYETIANMGSRRKRACILSVIPIDFVEDAMAVVRKTLAKGNELSIGERIKKIAILFNEIGVNQEMLEKRLGHALSDTIPDEFVDLHGIYNALKDKRAKREDFFDLTKTIAAQASESTTEIFRTAIKNPQSKADPEWVKAFDMLQAKIAERMGDGLSQAELESQMGMSFNDCESAPIETLKQALKGASLIKKNQK